MRSERVAAGLSALLLGCVEPRTEIVVRVSSEIPWGEGEALQSVVVRIHRGGLDGSLRSQRTTALGRGDAREPLPMRIGVLPAGTDLDTPVSIEVLGCAEAAGCETGVVRQYALVPFTRGATIEVELGLYNLCRGARCNVGEWCQQSGLCAPATQVPVRVLEGNAAATIGPVDAATFVDAAVADANEVASPSGLQRSCATPGTPGCGMVEIPAGTVTMGSDGNPCPAYDGGQAACLYEASPAVPGQRVSRFFIDRTEVTVARFRAFWLAGHPTPSGPIAYPGGSLRFLGALNTEEELRLVPDVPARSVCNWSTTGREDHPMNCVNWATAVAFCAWDMPGGRLPTEAEWEHLARGAEGRIYAWGDEGPTTSRVCWSVPERNSTCPVGAFAAGNAPRTGVSDLSAGVVEWLADAWVPYSDTRCWTPNQTDPLCTVTSTARSYRGGSWADNISWYLRGGSRGQGGPSGRQSWRGFRCARSP